MRCCHIGCTRNCKIYRFINLQFFYNVENNVYFVFNVMPKHVPYIINKLNE
jgi:hypothetical protein